MSDLQNLGDAQETATGVTSKAGLTASQFAASFITAIVIFSVQVVAFLLIKDRFSRIYQPRTYLVPERERTKPTPPGWFKWIKPTLNTSNSEFVQKCGLDAYFFLRYLRTLLKIFVPAALVILPILIPLNAINGRGGRWAQGGNSNETNVTGLDQLAWGNVAPNRTRRYWAHWLLAVLLIIYIWYIAFDELRNYIRMRQAYMTSPQHRLRASATTVLVSSIPSKWCTVEALDGLYDVFPGGLRNIWINRNFDELTEKVKKRDKLAKTLEASETDLIKKCYKKNEEKILKAEKQAGKKLTKEQRKAKAAAQDQLGREQAQGGGVSSGNPHQVQHHVHDVVDDRASSHSSSSGEEDMAEAERQNTRTRAIPVVGDGLAAVGRGFGKVGQGILGGIRGVNKGVNDTMDTTNGFVAPSSSAEAEARTSQDPYTSRNTAQGTHTANGKVTGASHKTGAHDASAKHATRSSTDRGRTSTQIDRDVLIGHQRSPISQGSTVQDEKALPAPPAPPTTTEKLKKAIGLASEPKESIDYPLAFEEEFTHDPDDAVWKRYLTEKDRDTMRLPIFGWEWMPALPLMGKKVDTIRYCRAEVARLNVEIEDDQANPERFPLMNSAFVQFNHQVAAHMACQSLSHHIPKQMAPRIVEIDPSDVIWDNMSVPWWQSYLRTAIVTTIVIGMIILWAIPVAFTSALSQLNTAAQTYTWLHWILETPEWFRSVLQGVLPPALLGLLLFLLPVILRALVRLQGTQSGMLVEMRVQRWYFFFLFVQLFLVVTIASSLVQFVSYFTSADGWTNVPDLLGRSIPKASNYFISYMLLQALSVSAGALLQVGALVGWFILAPIMDSTARAKFKRQTDLSDIKWGTFFPVYTNLACIGLIYSVISPLILVFNIVTFSLFWFVYRFNTLYVTRFTRDTGGLLYPNAINFTFVGVYMMEVALIGMFFLVQDENNSVACEGQAIGMIVMLILTGIYHILLNRAFSPLFRYLPITLEDDAVRRDEEFARAMSRRHGTAEPEAEDGEDLEDRLEAQERRERAENRQLEEIELEEIEKDKQKRMSRQQSGGLPELEPYEFQNPEIQMNLDKENKGIRFARKAAKATADHTIRAVPNLMVQSREERKPSWADRDDARNRRASNFGGESRERVRSDSFSTRSHHHHQHETRRKSPPRKMVDQINNFNPLLGNEKDVEAQQASRSQLADALYSGVNDELEDLTPDQRDALVQRAFQHSALRARRPVIWIPRDELGVSDDEVRRMGKFSKNLWVSNVRQGLDSKGRCVYSGAPPDFSEVDLIRL
jgi:calcium permeable stress-gated cation channel